MSYSLIQKMEHALNYLINPSDRDLWRKAIAEIEKLQAIKEMVELQAEDEGLWFNAKTAPEAYLQQELRKLHALVEGECTCGERNCVKCFMQGEESLAN